MAIRGRALPAITIGLAAILGLQTGVGAAQETTRGNRNSAIITIAAAPAPLSTLDTNSLMIWTAATLAVMLLMSRQARSSPAPVPIICRSRPSVNGQSGFRQPKMSITYHSGGLYGP